MSRFGRRRVAAAVWLALLATAGHQSSATVSQQSAIVPNAQSTHVAMPVHLVVGWLSVKDAAGHEMGSIDLFVQDGGTVVGTSGKTSGPWFDATLSGLSLAVQHFSGPLSASAVAINPATGGNLMISFGSNGTLRLSISSAEQYWLPLHSECWSGSSSSGLGSSHTWSVTSYHLHAYRTAAEGTLGSYTVTTRWFGNTDTGLYLGDSGYTRVSWDVPGIICTA